MKMLYEDAFGLWLKIQQIGLRQQTMSPTDSVLITWASIVLAPVYLLAQAFEDQSSEKFQEGVKNIEVDLALTDEQLHQLDRIFVNICLRTQPTLETSTTSKDQTSFSVDDKISSHLKTEVHNLEGESVPTTASPLNNVEEAEEYETQEEKERNVDHKEGKWRPPTSYYR